MTQGAQVLCDNLGGWEVREVGGVEKRERTICIPVADSC